MTKIQSLAKVALFISSRILRLVASMDSTMVITVTLKRLVRRTFMPLQGLFASTE